MLFLSSALSYLVYGVCFRWNLQRAFQVICFEVWVWVIYLTLNFAVDCGVGRVWWFEHVLSFAVLLHLGILLFSCFLIVICWVCL